MKTLTDITCARCGCTASTMWLAADEIEEVARAHVCPDGGRSETYSTRERVVLGPGERGRDDEARVGL